MRDDLRPEVRVTLIDSDVTFAESVLHFCARRVPAILVVPMTDVADLRKHGAWSRPDVVIFDPAQHEDAVAAVVTSRGLATQPAVVALTTTNDGAVVAQLARAGVLGWVAKHEPITALVDTIQTVHKGQARYPVEHLGAVMRVLGEQTRPAKAAERSAGRTLTTREQEVLAHLLSGTSSREIARRLHLSENTIRSHRRRIEAKLNVHV